MATRQYIGARYVPKFFENPNGGAEWVGNTQYEALTIVTRNGNSYTSRKNVPANIGSPENNDEYWVSTGLYNEQVEAYREEVQDVSERVEDIEKELKKYPNVIMIGDSYGHASGSNNGWIDKLKTKLNIASANLFESGIGGAGFKVDLGNNSFANMFATLIGTMTQDEIDNVGLVIVAGGSNDMGVDVNTLTARVKETMSIISNACVNAKIFIGEISGNIRDDFATAQVPRIVQAYRSATSVDRVYYMKNVEYCLHSRVNLNSDLVHPNNTGYEELTNAMYSALKDSYDYRYTSYGNVIIKPSGTTGADPVYLLDIDNNVAKLTVTVPIDIIFSTPLSYVYNTKVKVGSLANKAFIGASNNFYNFNRTFTETNVTVRFADTSLHNVKSLLQIDDLGDIYITNIDVQVSGGTSQLSSIDRIIIPRFNIVAPSIGC